MNQLPGVPTDEQLAELVGRQMTYEAQEELGRGSIRYFALAIGDTNPLYRDEDFADSTRWRGITAPPTLICESNQYLPGEIRETGYMGHEWELPVENPLVLRGGNEYEFFQPVRPSDRLTVSWRIVDAYQRQGSKGPLVFVVSQIEYRNQHAELLTRNVETMIYQLKDERRG